MAIIFDAAADRLLRTASLLTGNAAFTVMCWARYTTDDGNYQTIYSHNTDGFSGNFLWFQNGGTGNPWDLFSGGDEEVAGTTTVNTWYHVAIVRTSATALNLYVDANATPVATDTDDPGGGMTRMEFGGEFAANNDSLIGEIEAIKIWNVALSTADIASEYQYRNPQTNLANVHLVWRGITATADTDGYNDSSGNGRDATVGGTLGTASSPAGILGNDPGGGTTPSDTDIGTLAEAVGGIALSTTESGTGADAVSGVALPSTDAGIGTDAVTGIALPSTDAGTLAETVAIAVSTADSGTVSETENVDTGDSTTPSSDDTGTLAETATLTVALTSPDTGTLAETVVGIALASSDEFGQDENVEGTEPITANEGQTIALSAQTESGTLAETLALALSTAEAATLGEAPALAVSYSVTESGTFTEATLVQQGESNPVDAEAGTFGEFASVAVAVLDGDTGTASEGPAITASYISAETAALIESGGLLNFTGIAGGILSVSARAHGSLGIEA